LEPNSSKQNQQDGKDDEAIQEIKAEKG